MATMNVDEEETEICSICLIQFAKYTCPRCNIRYCSLKCYKNEKHSKCSEDFYRDSFVTELQQRHVSNEEKVKMMEMLKRLEESDSAEGDSGEDAALNLEKRLTGLNLDVDHEEVWQRLTPSERKEFDQMAHTGALSQLISTAPPWWEGACKLVVPLETDPSEQNVLRPLPRVPADLPSLDTLIKSKPVSPDIYFNVINVLYSYMYTFRLFNGSPSELPLEACETMLKISSCLSSNASFRCVEDATTVAMDAVQQDKSLFNSRSFSTAVLKDVSCVLQSSHVIRAMADLHSLLGSARSHIKSDKGVEGHLKDTSRKFWLARKKVYFYMVWANMPENASHCAELARVLDLKYETEVTSLKSVGSKVLGTNSQKKTVLSDNEVNGKRLVQEMDNEVNGKRLVQEVDNEVNGKRLVQEMDNEVNGKRLVQEVVTQTVED